MSSHLSSTGMHNDTLAHELNHNFRQHVWPVCVFLGFEATFGFIGNIFVLYVFLFRYHVCNFRYFVLCMAMIDITSSLTIIPAEILTELYWYVYKFEAICKIKSFFNMFTTSTIAMLLLFIAIDRYRKVCCPLRWQIRPSSAKIICVVTATMSLLVAIPAAIFWGVNQEVVLYNNVNVTVAICGKDQEYLTTKHTVIYSTTFGVVYGTQILSMFMLYIIIGTTLFRKKKVSSSCSNSRRKSNPDISESEGSSSNAMYRLASDIDRHLGEPLKNETGSTENMSVIIRSTSRSFSKKMVSRRVQRKVLIMFILTVVFLITELLYLSLSLMEAKAFRPLSVSGKVAYLFFFRLYFINHMINPFLYWLLDAKFRRVMRGIGNKMFKTIFFCWN